MTNLPGTSMLNFIVLNPEYAETIKSILRKAQKF